MAVFVLTTTTTTRSITLPLAHARGIKICYVYAASRMLYFNTDFNMTRRSEVSSYIAI